MADRVDGEMNTEQPPCVHLALNCVPTQAELDKLPMGDGAVLIRGDPRNLLVDSVPPLIHSDTPQPGWSVGPALFAVETDHPVFGGWWRGFLRERAANRPIRTLPSGEMGANDCNVNATARVIYAHRHTVAYRLERVRELTGLDPAATEDRKRLGLGLKALLIVEPDLPR